jgi:hypothetical protein
MTPEQFREIRTKELKLTAQEMAEFLGKTGRSTIHKYENGELSIPKSVIMILELKGVKIKEKKSKDNKN